MHIAWGVATDAGGRRSANEDSVLAQPPVFLVADGMGGHTHGAMASQMVVRSFAELADRWHPDVEVRSENVLTAIHRAQADIRQSLSRSGEPGVVAGSTVAGAILTVHDSSPYWLVFNVGDSRVYRFVHGELRQISIDHSVVQQLIDSGAISPEEAKDHPNRNVITRAVDSTQEAVADFWLLAANKQDRLLLCSDGLLAEISHQRINEILSSCADPALAAEQLEKEAIDGGSADNVSVVVVDASTSVEISQTRPREGLLEDAALATTVPRGGQKGTSWQ